MTVNVATIIGQLLLGWLAADLLTGTFHWWEDRIGRVEWPIIGPWIVAPNRLHHTDPLAFTRHGFLARNQAAIITALVVGAAGMWAFGPSFFWVALMLGSGLSNEVHRYAHQPSLAPPWLRMLQQTGFVQSARGHAVHHRPPHTVNYCVLTNWLNPVLEMAGVWGWLERAMGR